MSLLDVIRSGVAIADSITKDLQPVILLRRYLGENDFGSEQYSAEPGYELRALVDWKRTQVRTQGGDLTVSRVIITILDIEKLKEVTEGVGILEEDKITLSDGTTGPILDLSGFIDAGTGIPFATEVVMG